MALDTPVRLTIVITKSDADTLKQLAAENGYKISQLVRQFIRERLNQEASEVSS